MLIATQTYLASLAQITPGLLSHYLTGRRNASAPVADKLACLTGTDIRVWLRGGMPEDRQAAFAKWAAESQSG
ncbi:MAG: helix-turn-helix domain-containing protein [Deltaproteobacteria bacterium]|nr:helix-turn-helix domain-containing protein [Deltaproteobacteria bacterium]